MFKIMISPRHPTLYYIEIDCLFIYFSLKDDGREWMKSYGSNVIEKLKFRDAFAMIGQRGLSHGSAIEKVNPPSPNTTENTHPYPVSTDTNPHPA